MVPVPVPVPVPVLASEVKEEVKVDVMSTGGWRESRDSSTDRIPLYHVSRARTWVVQGGVC
jgi:hypothetical protein